MLNMGLTIVQADEYEFLDSLSYAREAWFAIQRPVSFEHQTFSPANATVNRVPTLQKAHSTSVPSNIQLRFAPIVQLDTKPDVLAPLEPRRSGSTSSVESSPETRKARPIPRPISPKATERRRLRTYSSDEGDSRDDSSDEDSQVGTPKSSRKRIKTSSVVCHTSAFRGVSCCGKDRKFQARIRDGSKVHYLGRFDNEFDAAIKYDEAARSHKGDAAVPNFVQMTHEECQMLRTHYFANNQRILPEFHHFLYQGTLERLEIKQSTKRAMNKEKAGE